MSSSPKPPSKPLGLGVLENDSEAPAWEQRITGSLPPRAERVPHQPVQVILKVARAGYVPEGAVLRAQLGPELLTAQTTWQKLEAIVNDPLVVSVALAEKVLPVGRG